MTVASGAPAYYERDGDRLVPLPPAISAWSPRDVHGAAVCAVVGRALDPHLVADPPAADPGADSGADPAADPARAVFVPARVTVDLFRAVRAEPLETRTEVVRDGNRIRVVDVTVHQLGGVVARATGVFLRRSTHPVGDIWQRPHRPSPPPEADATAPTDRPWYGSDAAGWTRSIADHQNASRKRLWARHIAAVAGEPATPLVRVAAAAESTSLLTNWGSEGIGFINADLSVGLARLPVGAEIGIEADNQVGADGIAVSTTTLYDRDGAFGNGMVVAVSNAARQIDFTVPRELRGAHTRL